MMLNRKKLQRLSKEEKTNKLEIKRMKKEDKFLLSNLKRYIKDALIDSANKGLYYCEINIEKWKWDCFNYLKVKDEVAKILDNLKLYYEFKKEPQFNCLCVKVYWGRV